MLRSLLKQVGGVVLFLFCVSAIKAQTPSFDDCLCSTDEEHFEQLFTLTSGPGEIWTFVSSTNFYETVDPYVPFTVGSLINEVPLNSGNYELSGFRLAGGTSSITLMRDAEMFTFDFTFECDFPEVIGDSYICEGTDFQFYEVVGLTGISWSAPGLNIIGPANGTTLAIDWTGVTPGLYPISVSGNYTTGPGGMMCPETIDYLVEVAENNVAGQIACNNSLLISLNGTCELEVLADMILEGTDINNDAYSIVLTPTEGGDPLPNEVVTSEYLGIPIIVEVTQDCGGNTCWGTLIIEDKSAPPIECPDEVTLSCDETTDPLISGLPILPMGVTVIDNGDGTFTLEDFDFCGDATLTYQDELVDNSLCEGPFGSIIERIWIVTDNAGNTSTCSQLINVERADIGAVIVWPDNFDDVLPGGQGSLQACGDWIALDNGHPSPETTGYPEGTFCANVEVSYVDTYLEKCGNKSFKVIRRWTVQDICGDEDDVLNHNQYITVKDDIAPVFKPVDEPINVEATGHTCISDIVVPAPELLEPECSGWGYIVGYKLADGTDEMFEDVLFDGVVYDNQLGLFVIENIEATQDTVWIIYILEDHCYNTSMGAIEVIVVDNEEPVPVCDIYSNVGLNEHGVGHAGVGTFDDGSWDNCSLDFMEVRRMDGDPCGLGTSDFSDEVFFCCDDVGKEILVQLRVHDASGNTNECMVTVIVQDNIAPKLVSCPGPRFIDCDVDLDDLPYFGTPVFSDECGYTLTKDDVIVSTEDCGLGTVIRRTFTATDAGGNSETCIQILTLRNNDPFTESDIDWPDDIEMFEGCIGADIDPDNLPNNSDRPDYDAGPCDMIADNYSDVIFLYVDDVCQKVLRKWVVVNNCTHETWTHTQIIKVTNETSPEISCDDVEITDVNLLDCYALANVTATASDDCTADEDLIWTYIIDNDPLLTGDQSSFSLYLDVGHHTVDWTVEDECGNISTCTTEFEIEDVKAPSPVCLEYVITTIKEGGSSTAIWAIDFIKDAFDDCAEYDDLSFSFESDQVVSSMIFTCEDITSGNVDTIPLNIYVTDPAGNQDFCTTNLILQDNLGECPNSEEEEEEEGEGEGEGEEEEEQRVEITGAVYAENNAVMAEVEINLSAEMPGYPVNSLTDEAGEFAFEDLDMYMDYRLEASYDGSYLEGVSTLDLVLIQKHILGVSSLDSPYKIIAADANNSESISAVDLVELRKLILGIYDELPSNASWRFVDQSFEFPNPYAPFPFVEHVSLSGLDYNAEHKDFVAVKIGDVNGTTAFREEGISVDNRSEIEKAWYIEDQYFMAGDKLEIDVLAGSSDLIEGFQVAYRFRNLVVKSVVSNHLEIGEQQYNVLDDELRISWYDQHGAKIQKDEVLFTIIAEVISNGSLAAELGNQVGLRAEIYTTLEGGVSTYPLETRLKDVVENGFVLYQNVPNPFSERTSISFHLPSKEEVNITVTDYTGRVIFSDSKSFDEGYNSYELNSTQMNTSGILYLKLETKSNAASQRMLLIK